MIGGYRLTSIYFSFVLSLLLYTTIGQVSHADERVLSIRELMNEKENWRLFAENGSAFTVRGVIGSRTDAQLHMRNCPLPFYLKSPDSFPRLKPGVNVIRLQGRFQLARGKPQFSVSKVTSEFNLAQVHRQMSVDIDPTDPEAWRKLAEYTASEAEFYDSAELFQVAARAFEHSYLVARTQAGGTNARQIKEWIAAMREFGVSDDAVEIWEYERLQMLWDELRRSRKRSSEQLLQLAKTVSQTSKASLKPLEVPLPQLEEQYQKAPVETFREANQTQQNRLWRLLYREIMLDEILSSAKTDGSNADRIRDAIAKNVPDRPDLIQKHDSLWLDWRFSQLSKAGRDEAIELSTEYRNRQQPDRAQEVLETWLEKRLEFWKKDEAAGYVRAAQQYLDLLEDRDPAYELLRKAWRLSPGEEQTASALRALGYRLHGGTWITKKKYDALPPDPVEEAISRGEVLKGMTASQVLRALGKAEQKRHAFSRGHVSEAWVYGEDNRKRLVIHMLRSATTPSEQARVIAIGEMNAVTDTLTVPDKDDEPDDQNN